MKRKPNTWFLLVLSTILGPVLLIYWAYRYAYGLFVEPSVHKGVRTIGIADIGLSLSFASTIGWLIFLGKLF